MYIKSVSADNGKGNGDEDGNRDRDVDEYTHHLINRLSFILS
jgi:hypothetical protein